MNSKTVLWGALFVSALIGVVLLSCGTTGSDVSESSGGSEANSGAQGSGGAGLIHSGGATSSGGGSGLSKCAVSQEAMLCESVSLEMPPQVTLRSDSGSWDTTMQGKMTPGTYVLTDLAKHGDAPTCLRTVSAIYVFGGDGHFAHGWDEGTHSLRYSGTYEDGPVDGTVKTTVDCPASATSDSGGLSFRMSEPGFTATNSDGTVYTFSRR